MTGIRLNYGRILSLGSLVLAFALNTFAQQDQSHKQNPQVEAGRVDNPVVQQHSPEIEKLAKMLVGNWHVVATREPSVNSPKGRKDVGTNRIVLGPGGRSVVENYRTDGDSGPRVALGILWWDEKAQGYRTMFCDNADLSGCSLYDGLGKWEGYDLVFRFRLYRDGSRIEGKEVFTAYSPFSFIVRFYESRDGGPEDATWTVNNTKAE